jgi:hypothetical protein
MRHLLGLPVVLDLEGSAWTAGSRPRIPQDIRELIRTLSRDNVGWGAPGIQSELLKLGIKISESSISKYMVTVSRHMPAWTG